MQLYLLVDIPFIIFHSCFKLDLIERSSYRQCLFTNPFEIYVNVFNILLNKFKPTYSPFPQSPKPIVCAAKNVYPINLHGNPNYQFETHRKAQVLLLII